MSWVGNGLAQLGNYCSAASFLGVAGGIALVGIDGWWLALGFLAAWVFLLLLIGAPLKNTGRYTVGDVMLARFGARKEIKTVAMLATIVIGILYLVPQIVGSGHLFHMLLGWEYTTTIVVAGVLMAVIVAMGGMFGTTWNQILQGVMLWSALVIIFVVGLFVYFGGNPVAIITSGMEAVPPHLAAKEAAVVAALAPLPAEEYSAAVATAREMMPNALAGLSPGVTLPNIWNQISVWLALLLGTGGLPHILTRFYTVKDAKVAQKSAELTIACLASFYAVCLFIGILLMYALYPTLVELLAAGQRGTATNMALAIFGEKLMGQFGLGIVAAGAVAAMVSTSIGLLISSTTSFTHDFYGGILKPESSESERLMVAKIATVIFAALSVLLGWWLKDENVAVLVAMCFGIAGSTFTPVLVATLWWDRLTKNGLIVGMYVGLISSLVFTFARFFALTHFLGIPVLANPGLYSVPLAVLSMVIVSYRSKDVGEVEEFMSLAHKS